MRAVRVVRSVADGWAESSERIQYVDHAVPLAAQVASAKAPEYAATPTYHPHFGSPHYVSYVSGAVSPRYLPQPSYAFQSRAASYATLQQTHSAVTPPERSWRRPASAPAESSVAFKGLAQQLAAESLARKQAEEALAAVKAQMAAMEATAKGSGAEAPALAPADAEAAKAAEKAAKKAKVKAQVDEVAAKAKARAADLIAAAGTSGRPKTIVLTGGPGVGKTTLINEVAKRLGCPVVPEAAIQAIDALNKLAGKEGQKAWRGGNSPAFGDLVGRVAMSQEAAATTTADPGPSGVVLFDRTVLDNFGYSLQKGYPVPDYLDAEAAAAAVARIDYVLLLDQVASKEDIEKRNRETGRMTDPVESVKMTAALEDVYTKLGCKTVRIPRGTVDERVAELLRVCDIALP